MTDSARKPDGVEMVEFKVDGRPFKAPKGQNLLEALLEAGEEVSYFCYHPGLSIAACCRQCLVGMGGRMVPSCQMTVQPEMEIDCNTEAVLDARRQMLEFTLLNHPVDCVICDKAGECTLQRHYMDWDAKPTRADHAKVDKPKKVDLGPEIVLDAERCILCSRCIRFCTEIAGQTQLVFEQRGNHSVLTTAPGQRLDNPYSLNTVDICPVGALTDKDFRFQIRVWELLSTRSVCNGCAAGCPTEIHHRDGTVYRLVPPKRWDMNLNWMCDFGRRTYKEITRERLTMPRIGGQQAPLEQAVERVADVLRGLMGDARQSIGVALGADVTNEDNFAAARFAFDFLEAGQVYLGEHPGNGAGDQILRRDDPNPNRAGAKACGRGKLRSAADLAKDLSEGRLRALYVVGDALSVPDDGAALDRLELLAVQASHRSALTDRAHVVLPAACWAEVDGTITNDNGTVQRMRPAIEPPGMARPHWDLIGRVAKELGLTVELESAQEVFLALKEQVPLFSAAEWGEELPTVMLRFAGRRG